MWTEPLHLVVNGQQFSQKKKKEKKKGQQEQRIPVDRL